jgi:hypothetical protein
MKSEWETDKPTFGKRGPAMHSPQPGYKSSAPAVSSPQPGHKKGGKAGKRKGGYPAKAKIQAAGHEMKVNPPAILAHTAKKFGRKAERKQRIAVMLAKARKAR